MVIGTDELPTHLHTTSTPVRVANLFSSLRLLNADVTMADKSVSQFTLSGVELVGQAIKKKEQMLKKVKELHEVNPILGHR